MLLLYSAAMVLYAVNLFSTSSVTESRLDTFRIPRSVLFAGFVLHAASLAVLSLRSLNPEPRFALVPSLPDSLGLISLLLVASFLLIERRIRVSVLGVLVAPLALGLVVLSGVLLHLDRPGTAELESNGILWFHIGLTIIGHAAFFFAFAVSLALIVQEALLKRKRFYPIQRRLPSLATLDYLNSRFLIFGFVCMLVGVGTGVVVAMSQGVSFLDGSARVFWSGVTLMMYAVLVTARLLRGLRGSRAAWLSVAGFATVVASFISLAFLGGGFHVH
jgi:ABC-type uncharacterized transport system permease subunit